jgi:hypothetical protein
VCVTATDVEGIFRLSGSEKRIKELREAFNSPDRFGKGLDWTGYTVHDAANILRRYFNQLPEPIIPLEFYECFRDPLRNHQSQAVGEMDLQSPSVGDFDPDATIRIYQNLITELPPLNRQLLLYILDLLAVFASKSDLNKMTTPNLAAIFQPGILSHPSHDMAPPEYRLSQDVLIFLIENQDHFLIGMQGTAADEKTVQEVESGPPTPAVRPSKSIVGRSSSNASKYSAVRRSVSVSSRQSRNSVSSPMTPNFHGSNSPLGTPVPTSGVHRSNTVPSNRSPMTPHGGRFQRDHQSHTPSPAETPFETGETPMWTPAEMPGAYPFSTPLPRAETGPPQFPAAPKIIAPSPESKTPVTSFPSADPASTSSPQGESSRSARPDFIAMPNAQSPTGPPGQEGPPSGSGIPRTFTAMFGKSTPTEKTREVDRKPNKLQKRKMQGGLPSASSSTNSLGGASASGFAEDASIAPSTGSGAPLLASSPNHNQTTPTQQHTFLHPTSTESTPVKLSTLQREAGTPSLTLPNPPMSPAHSYRSHSEFTEGELDNVEPLDHQGIAANLSSEAVDYSDKERKRKFWPSGRKKGESVSYGAGHYNVEEAQRSRSSVLSTGERDQARKSATIERGTAMSLTSDDEKERERKNPLTWIERKLAVRAEKKEEKERLRDEAREEKKRAKSPSPLDRSSVGESMQSLSAVSAAGSSATGGSMVVLQAMGPAQSQSSPKLDPTMPVSIPPRGKSADFRRDGSGQHRQSLDAPHPISTNLGATSPSIAHGGLAGNPITPVTPRASSSGNATATKDFASLPRDIPAKQAADLSVSPLGSPASIARSSMDASSRERERQRSLLDIGEDALEKSRSRD